MGVQFHGDSFTLLFQCKAHWGHPGAPESPLRFASEVGGMT